MDRQRGLREREKKSDGLERGKQILGEKNLSEKSDFGFGGKKAISESH